MGYIMTKEQLKDMMYKRASLEDFEETLDKYISSVGDINIRDEYKENILRAAAINGNVDIVKMLLRKGARVEEEFDDAIWNEKYDVVPVLLEAAQITAEEKQWVEKICREKNLEAEQLDKILSALEKVEVVDSKLVRVPIQVAMDIEPHSEAEAKDSLCASLHLLSNSISQGKKDSSAAARYLSKEEQQIASKLSVQEDVNGYGSEEKAKQLNIIEKGLGNKEDAEFVMDIIDRTRESMADCLNGDINSIYYSFSLLKNSPRMQHWHRDGGSPEDIRMTLAIKGDGTMLAHGSENMESGYSVPKEDIKEFSQVAQGEISVFNIGKEMAVHSGPLATDSRVLVIFDCPSCAKNITEQSLLQNIGESIAPEIKAFNETRNISMESALDIPSVYKNSSMEEVVGALPMEVQKEISANRLPFSQNANASYQVSSNVQGMAVQSALSLSLLEIGKNIRKVFTNSTSSKNTGIEKKLSGLKKVFKERGYGKLAEDTENIIESIEKFNQQSFNQDKSQLKKRAKEIISKYEKLERVAKVVVEKDLSKKPRSR